MLVAALEDEAEETVELVAFPKSYEKFRELLQEDALLRVTAKVDRRNDGIQLVLESVVKLDPAAVPPAEGGQPMTMDLEGLGEAEPLQPPFDQHPQPFHIDGRPTIPENAMSNGNSAHTPAAPTPAEPEPPAAPLITEPVSIIRPKARPAANGNGHDASAQHTTPQNDNGYAASARSLKLRLPHARDFDAGVQLMQQVYELLRESSGDDTVIIQLPKDSGVVLLKPRSGVRCSEALVDQLSGLLGAERVLVE
jgi:DNA polymerase-3 subunit alpha